MRWPSWVVVLCFASACGETPLPPPPVTRPVVEIRFSPKQISEVPAVALSSGAIGLESVSVFGNVPTSLTAKAGPAVIDATGSGPVLTLSDLPDGLYSRLRIDVDSVSLEGSWNAIPVHVDFAIEGAVVDLRDEVGRELAIDRSIAFEVVVDPSLWFAQADLTQSFIEAGQIVIDARHNVSIALAIAQAVLSSFTLAPA